MSLQKWATDIANKLRTEKDVVIKKEDTQYRGLLASMLINFLSGSGTTVIEGLLQEAFNLSIQCQQANVKISELQQALQPIAKDMKSEDKPKIQEKKSAVKKR